MNEEWRLKAACRGADPTLFFPDRVEDAGRAKRICGGCQVRLTCREYALALPDLHGIWGGTNSQQRAYIRRDRRGVSNAAKTHCKQGHEFTPENTRISSYNNQRVCRMCAADNQRRHRERGTRRAAK